MVASISRCHFVDEETHSSFSFVYKIIDGPSKARCPRLYKSAYEVGSQCINLVLTWWLLQELYNVWNNIFFPKIEEELEGKTVCGQTQC